MNSWIEEQLQMLLTTKNKEDLLTGLFKSAKLLGFDYFAYGLQLAVPLTAPKVELINNYPDQWQKLYQENNYLLIDPTVMHGTQTTRPVVWSESLFSDSRSLWEDANSNGLKYGWAQSTYGKKGVSGLLTLARSDDPISEAELIKKTPLLVWFTQLAHQGLQDVFLPEMMPQIKTTLTSRETEIIRWTADGKTSYEISVIIGIGERTVNFHLNNVMKKLNVTNKTAAAVQAVILGII
ncbi:autoinducer binding domain-containing protein [Litoribacillus peritrichatus]|uniref:LuxR family transcriptional regulator AbaR n=1 Tax=Litoribacillus peritrichatus TaxID=718191 RepID=A0ABP7MRL5_9GAMM